MRAIVGVVSAVLCCVLVVPAIAEAKVKRSPTRIAFTEADFESIRAELRSPFRRCVRERTVSLAESGAEVILHTTRTARDGSFSIGLDKLPAGISAFQLTVAPKRIANRLCGRDTANVTFDAGTLTGGPNNGAFRGVLTSSVNACEPDRMISLYEIGSDPVFVGWNLTDGTGAWTIAQAGGTYEARAEPVIINDREAITYCKSLVSAPWSYEDPPEE